MKNRKIKLNFLNFSLFRGSFKKRVTILSIFIICTLVSLIVLLCNTVFKHESVESVIERSYNFTSLYSFSGDHNREEVLYVSRHLGTKSNFWYVADTLKYNMDVLTPLYFYNERPKCLDNGECGSFYEDLCNQYNYIIVSDVIPDVFPFLVNKCQSKIVIEITNRFDLFVKVHQHKKYMKTFSDNLMNNKNFIVVANNPFENYFACNRGIFFPKFFLIRPTGYAPPELISKAAKSKKVHDLVIVNRTVNDDKFARVELKKRNVKFDFLDQNYGGPMALAKYKAMLLLPYQVSIMKMMENFRYGVAMLIPSEPFFRKLAENNSFLFPAKELLKIPGDLEKYTEFYNEEFRDLFIYFDSWDDIQGILDTVDFDAVKAKGIEFMKNYEKDIIYKWKQVFGKEEERSAIMNIEPICNLNRFYNYP